MPESKKTIPNPSPRTSFQESSDVVTKHRKLLDLPEFHRAIRFALLQYQRVLAESSPRELTHPNYMHAAAVCFNQLKGAQDFVDTLLKLSEPPAPVASKPSGELDHKIN
jgi:hypothetical protein